MLGLQLALGEPTEPEGILQGLPIQTARGRRGDSPQPQVQRKEGGEADHLREQKKRMRIQKERYRERDTKRAVIETRRDGETEGGDEMKPDKGRHLLNQAKKYWWTEEKRGMDTMATACRKHRLCN